MTITDQIRTDGETGTPGPWPMHDCQSHHVIMQPNAGKNERYNRRIADIPQWYCRSLGPTKEESAANAKRIARVPDLEALALAGEELAKSADDLISFHNGPPEAKRPDIFQILIRRQAKALAAWEKANE